MVVVVVVVVTATVYVKQKEYHQVTGEGNGLNKTRRVATNTLNKQLQMADDLLLGISCRMLTIHFLFHTYN
jgi:hypothetical protein